MAQKRPEKLRIQSFAQFWPYYLQEHRNQMCRSLHFWGTTFVLFMIIMATVFSRQFFYAAPFVGYGFAWVGHFVYEKNRPATFRYPLWSLRADFLMWWRMLIGNSLK